MFAETIVQTYTCGTVSFKECDSYFVVVYFFPDDPSKEGTGLDSLSGTSLHSDLTSATATTGGKQGEDTDRGREPFHFIR